MWTRSALKDQAKKSLKGTFLISVLVIILFILLTGGENSNLTLKLGEDATKEMEIRNGIFGYSFGEDYYNNIVSYPLTALFLLFGVFASIVSVLYQIFIAAPLNIGLSKYFLVNRRNPEDNTPLNLFDTFRSGNYLNGVVVLFLQNLFIFLHFLLLIIPGIIKVFKYYMVSFIMADHPDMHYKDALALSTEMTDGHKMNIFVLELSFIGWYLLSALTLGLATPLVSTYRKATITELYEVLKNPNERQEVAPPGYF
ncbi:MAG TPA: DUF975 family protein [Proteiniclasticum sp.]|nr:DUF975 family protein [Proteiniclasticum sp.]